MERKVLIVDDEPDVVTYLTTILKHNGYTPLSAHTAQSGFETVAREKPDLILLDIMMPRESGISLYTRLKEDRRFKDIPIVIISGVAQAGEFDFRDFVSDKSIPPPEKYIEKPVQVEEFVRIIDELTGGPSSAKSKAGSNAKR